MEKQTRLLARQEVQDLLKIGRTTLYRWMREGRFPEPMQIGPGAVRWHESEILAWIEERPRAKGNLHAGG